MEPEPSAKKEFSYPFSFFFFLTKRTKAYVQRRHSPPDWKFQLGGVELVLSISSHPKRIARLRRPQTEKPITRNLIVGSHVSPVLLELRTCAGA